MNIVENFRTLERYSLRNLIADADLTLQDATTENKILVYVTTNRADLLAKMGLSMIDAISQLTTDQLALCRQIQKELL